MLKNGGVLDFVFSFLWVWIYIHLLSHCLFPPKLNTQRHKITDWKYYFILNNSKQSRIFFLPCIMTTHILQSTVLTLIHWARPSWYLHSGDFLNNFAFTHTHTCHQPLQRAIADVLTALYRCQAGLISAHTPLL